MRNRLFKRTVIALVYILLLAGFGAAFYYFRQPTPTCFDHIKNQDEEDVDCGGLLCPSCELTNIKDLEVLSVFVLPTQGSFYDLCAEIKNPNQNYGSSLIPYEFAVYDARGAVLAKYAGETFILPNQTKYIVRSRAGSTLPVKRATVSFGQAQWQKPEGLKDPELAVRNKEYRLLSASEVGFSQARGVVINQSSFDFAKVRVNAILFDSGKKILAAGTTELRALAAGQQRDFSIVWPDEFAGQVTGFEIHPETNLLDADNTLSMPADRERFQEF